MRGLECWLRGRNVTSLHHSHRHTNTTTQIFHRPGFFICAVHVQHGLSCRARGPHLVSNMSIFNIKKGARRDRETVCGRHFARQMRPLLQQKKHNSIQSCFSLCISARLPSVKSFCQFDRRPNGISGGCAEPVRKTQVTPYKNLAVPLPWVVPPPSCLSLTPR